VQPLGALEVGLRQRALGRRLEIGRVRFADLQAVEDGQVLPGFHLVAQIGVDFDDTSGDARHHVRYAVLIGADGGGQR
jgi:hypothetical protein